MRVAVVSFSYEGNSFSNRLDGEEAFARNMLLEGDAVLPLIAGRALAVTGGMDALHKAGLSTVMTLAAKGVSGGSIVDAFYQNTKARILRLLEQALPFDGIYMALHGAMICESLADPEGDLLAAVRQLVGPDMPIAASLDLHANVTPEMVRHADILVGYETYPHEDAYTTGYKAADLLAQTLQGKIKPSLALRRVNAVLPVLGGSTQDDAPMARIRVKAREMEAAGEALSISYFPVQPWIDYPDVGIAALAITNDQPEQARAVATDIVSQMWQCRQEFEIPMYSPTEAITAALAMDESTVLLVDGPDSVGGGANGDNPGLLSALLSSGTDVDAAICIVDAGAAQMAHEIGIGKTADFRIGASLDARYYEPVNVQARVEKIVDGSFIYAGGAVAGAKGNMGPTALLRVGKLRIVVCSHPFYEYADEHYRICDIDFRTLRLVVFKNLMNFRNLLGDSVGHVIVDGPGGTPPRLQTAPWQRKQRPFWPCDDFPETPFME